MGIVKLIHVQSICGIEEEDAAVLTAQQRLRDRKRERLLPADSLCRAVPQAGHSARADEEGFVTQAHGVEARRTRQRREGLRVAEEALSATLWDIEAKNPIGPTGIPEHQRDTAKQKIHGRDSRIGQVLERHESLAQLQVIAGMVEIVDFPFLGRHNYAISLCVDRDILRMALESG